jgi:predicted nucleic acid-binding protein
MNKFEEAIQIAKGVTNFLRMKANIANNDIEELHKRRYAVCKVCEFRNQIMIKIHADVLCN